MSSASRPRILLVDTSYNSAVIIARRLETRGYRVDTASSAAQAIRFLNECKSPPDLVLVEVLSAGQDLFDLPRVIERETRWGRTIPVAAHTVLSDGRSISRATQAGYADYIIRPIEITAFVERIRNLVATVPTLGSESVSVSIAENAVLRCPVRITTVNETGLVCDSDFGFPVNSVLLVESPTLQQLGFSAVNVRIAKVEETHAVDARYRILATFVALTAHEIRRIHAHCLNQAARQSRRASA